LILPPTCQFSLNDRLIDNLQERSSFDQRPAVMPANQLPILYEDNHLLVVNKPCGIATQGAEAGETSVVTLAKHDLKARYQKPGNVYLGVVSRLDSAVSGVLVLARTSKAAARLNEQFRSRKVEKLYWAVVAGESDPPASGACEDWIAKDERMQRMGIVEPSAPGAQLARLSFRRLARIQAGWLLEVSLETGRKHQIRLQLASRGLPILGDAKYGSQRRFPSRAQPAIALHARRLALDHPVSKTRLDLTAPLPETWGRLGVDDCSAH
jgi:23S rRNA pseudouridine1911/1915/1917 synthase